MIVITGANNGLGLELVKIFLKYNFYVLAISKSNNNLNKINNNNLKIITGNLNKKSTLKKINKYVTKNNIHIDLLINKITMCTVWLIILLVIFFFSFE